jgi:hypothetical protein
MARHKDIYELPQLKMEITITKIFLIIVGVTFSFVLPFFAIENYKQSSNTTTEIASDSSNGQVAGVSTEATNSTFIIPLTNTEVDLNSQSGSLISVGMILIGVSFILLIFLLVDSVRSRK